MFYINAYFNLCRNPEISSAQFILPPVNWIAYIPPFLPQFTACSCCQSVFKFLKNSVSTQYFQVQFSKYRWVIRVYRLTPLQRLIKYLKHFDDIKSCESIPLGDVFIAPTLISPGKLPRRPRQHVAYRKNSILLHTFNL